MSAHLHMEIEAGRESISYLKEIIITTEKEFWKRTLMRRGFDLLSLQLDNAEKYDDSVGVKLILEEIAEIREELI